jgi:hypothetical protein
MPSHIFTRVGYWNDSIASNKESARVAKEEGEQHDQAHAMDYMVYAYLQLAQDKDARAVVDELTKLEFKIERFPGPYAVAASQARYVFERGDWKAAAELQVRPTKYLYVDAITYFARAVGAARAGNPKAAKVDIAHLVPGASQAGGMHARGLAVGHPAGAIYAGANRVSAAARRAPPRRRRSALRAIDQTCSNCFATGKVKRTDAPREPASNHNRPPWASTIVLHSGKPMPSPSALLDDSGRIPFSM